MEVHQSMLLFKKAQRIFWIHLHSSVHSDVWCVSTIKVLRKGVRAFWYVRHHEIRDYGRLHSAMGSKFKERNHWRSHGKVWGFEVWTLHLSPGPLLCRHFVTTVTETHVFSWSKMHTFTGGSAIPRPSPDLIPQSSTLHEVAGFASNSKQICFKHFGVSTVN